VVKSVSSGGKQVIRLRHGTTRQRAEAIALNGPDPAFREPGGSDTAVGFSTDRAGKFYTYPSPEDYARAKAINFPGEGGPAVVEIDVPEAIVQKADLQVEVRFEPGFGLEELLASWPSLPRRILVP
jgi:hypothetical protein